MNPALFSCRFSDRASTGCKSLDKGSHLFFADGIRVSVGENTALDLVLQVGAIIADPIDVRSTERDIDSDDATRAVSIQQALLTQSLLSARNFTQLVGLSPSVSTFLTEATIVGRNTQNFSVNGARISQNNIQINGVDASGVSTFVIALSIASPAPESLAEVNVQTSMYDATFGHAAGGSIQAITKSGSNKFNGSVYDYFRDAALTANNPLSVAKEFTLGDGKILDVRAEAFNLLNNVNFANPISNLNASKNSFGKLITTSNNPRIIQFVAAIRF
jgi:hypothetical protein